MQKLCGDAQAGGAAGRSAARRPSGARNAGQPSRWMRRSANRKRWAAIQPMDCSMCRALATKFGAGVGAVNAASAAHNVSRLPLKPANPELAALVGHDGLRRGQTAAAQRGALEQARHQKQRDHRNTEAQVGQSKVRQQRHRALAGPAQIAAHTDRSLEVHIHQRAAVETVAR